MPKSKAIVDTDSESSGSDSDKKPKKKQKVEKKKDSESAKPSATASKSKAGGASAAEKEEENMFNLGKKKFATVSEFRGTKYVNIREYYGDEGELKPGKKGIALSVEQWNQLKESMGAIDAALEEL